VAYRSAFLQYFTKARKYKSGKDAAIFESRRRNIISSTDSPLHRDLYRQKFAEGHEDVTCLHNSWASEGV